ncbi:MAG: hypothetical protein HND52_13720 [Ignavibacteriae bacterium]|jgi:HEAT repeat protein|nr:hypothetical protein [Ignavibacteriota bacterium]NOG99012.1 hypothetical protein [Ignavibacteriota bacterium]
MKTKSYLIFAFLFSLSILSAKTPLTDEAKSIAELNYLAGLESDNEGLRGSSAYFLGEINSSKAVIPLMRLLRNDESECVRTVAALSLIKLKDARGVYLVKKAIEFNDSEKVRDRCERFYAAFLLDERAKKIESDIEQFAGVFK